MKDRYRVLELIMVLVLIFFLGSYNQEIMQLKAVIPEKTVVQAPEVVKEPYTIFQYCNGGQVNVIYAIEHYCAGSDIYFKRPESKVFIAIDKEGVLPVEGYIEDETELMKFGVYPPLPAGEFGF